MAINTKYFVSGTAAAPVLSGTAGAMIALLDAVLINGYGSLTATSLVVTSSVATMTFGSAHSFLVDSIILVEGVGTPAELNGEKRVVSVTTNTVTFAATGTSDQTATGTITAKMAPCGWTKIYSGTNLAAYKSNAIDGTGCVLKIDDTGTTTCRVMGYESMSNITTGVGLFPTAGQQSGGLYWPKSTAASTAGRYWQIFADDRVIYFFSVPAIIDATYAGCVFCFGDLNSVKSNDPYSCLISGSTGSSPQSTASAGCLSYAQVALPSSADLSVPRSYTSIGSAQICGKTSALIIAAGYSGVTGSMSLPYPNGPDNGLFTTQVQVASNGGIRGSIGGVYHSPQVLGNSFSTGDKIDGQGALAGRRLVALRVGNIAVAATTAGVGTMFIDIYGPWR